MEEPAVDVLVPYIDALQVELTRWKKDIERHQAVFRLNGELLKCKAGTKKEQTLKDKIKALEAEMGEPSLEPLKALIKMLPSELLS